MKRICCELVCVFNSSSFFFLFTSEVSLKDFEGEFLLSYFIESLVLLTMLLLLNNQRLKH